MRRETALAFVMLAALGCGGPEEPLDGGPESGPDASTCPGWWAGNHGPDGDLTCTPAEEGSYTCRGGPGSGTGWDCRGGCWQMFFDGPCAPCSFSRTCDAGVDASCGSVGGVGGNCRGAMDGIGGTCPAGAACESEHFADLATRTPPTFESALGVPIGEPDPDHPGFFRVAASPDPSQSLPIAIATGSLCTTVCDAAATFDSCGTCSSCTSSIGMRGVIRVPDLYGPAELPFGETTGWCRADCTFDPTSRDLNCPDGHTCSPDENVCVEGCRSDAECQAMIVPTWDGGRVSVIDPLAGTCDPSTLRCRWTRAATETVGDACVRDADCTEHVGRCLPGGMCAEVGCATASDTLPTTGVCDGGRGVCFANDGSNDASTCVAGCVRHEDCEPTNICVPLPDGATAGAFTGYCVAVCDTVASDPDGAGPLTDADDVLYPCRATERCDVPAATGETQDPDGTCRPPCSTDADCAPPARCELSASAGGTVCRMPMRAAP